MPTIYERLDEAGNVVERVQPVDGDYEDTRLGLAVLDGLSGWRLAEDAPAPEPAPPAEPVFTDGETNQSATDGEHADGGTDTEE